MRTLLSIAVFVVRTWLIARLLMSSEMVGHWISVINYSDTFARWRVLNAWVGVENEEDLWDYICLALAAPIAPPSALLFHRRIRRSGLNACPLRARYGTG